MHISLAFSFSETRLGFRTGEAGKSTKGALQLTGLSREEIFPVERSDVVV